MMMVVVVMVMIMMMVMMMMMMRRRTFVAERNPQLECNVPFLNVNRIEAFGSSTAITGLAPVTLASLTGG